MRESVRAKWLEFNHDLEGRFNHPYLDVEGLVTTAVGVLIDPSELALSLPWTIDGRAATQEEIRRDWQAIKARQDLKNRLAKTQASVTRIRLSEQAIDALVYKRLAANVAYLRKLMPYWEDFPADAQMAILALAWAVGAGFKRTRPAFLAAVNRADWLAAKQHSRIRTEGNAGVAPRNRKIELCFDNALTVVETGTDPDVLHWPSAAPRPDPASLRKAAMVAVASASDVVAPAGQAIRKFES